MFGNRAAYKQAEEYAKRMEKAKAMKKQAEAKKERDESMNSGRSPREMDNSVSMTDSKEGSSKQRGVFSLKKRTPKAPPPVPTHVLSSSLEKPPPASPRGAHDHEKKQSNPPEKKAQTVTASKQPMNSSGKHRSGKLTAQETLAMICKTIESQEKREEQLIAECRSLRVEAKRKLAAGNKNGALRAMKNVKRREHEQGKISRVIETLEEQRMAIDVSINQQDIYHAMRAGADCAKGLNNSVSLESVDSLMESLQEAADYQVEIHEILSQPANNLILDDDDLLAELEDIMDTEEEEDASLPTATKFPVPPSGMPKCKHKGSRSKVDPQASLT